MIRCFKRRRTANARLKPAPYRRLSATSTLRFNPKSDASAFASPTRPGLASRSRRNGPLFQLKSLGPLPQLPQCGQASSSASNGHGGLNHTALHELHAKKGGKMVPFGGYSMPVEYSDLGVGESHKWTREKASLFDVGHM